MPCTATAAGAVNMVHARTPHPLVLEDHPHPAGPGQRRRGLYVDCETTGFSSEHDALIELAMLPFTYTTNGAITDVHRDQTRTWRQDPGRPVPPEITHITGLTDEDLASQAIDVATATELLVASHLVVAHNARFDCPFVEWVVPTARAAPWACSRHEVPWEPRHVPFARPRVPPVRLRRVLVGPPPRARGLRGRRVATHPDLARHRPHRLRDTPRDRRDADGPRVGRERAVRSQGPATHPRLPLDARGPRRDPAIVVDGRRPT